MAASDLIEALNERRGEGRTVSALARRLRLAPQMVHKTLTEDIPIRWEMACAIWDVFPELLPELLKYMKAYRQEERRPRQGEKGEDGGGPGIFLP